MAQVETAKLDYDSKQVLFRENVISEYDLSTAKNTLAVAEARLELARAPPPRCRVRRLSGTPGGFVGHKTYTCSPNTRHYRHE